MLRQVLIALTLVCASAVAAEPTTRTATTKPSGWGVRQVLVADPKLPHVLLIGDSILNGYNSHAAELLRAKVNLDAWVTPGSLGPGAIKEMTALLNEHTYDVILFNDIGLHAWQPGRIPDGQYEPLIRAHVAALQKLAPRAKLIFATTTPMTTKTKPIAVDAEFDPVITQRNQIAVKVMAENQIPVADFYGLLVDKPDLAAGDRFHWTRPAYQLIGHLAAERIAKALDFQLPATQPGLPAK